MTYPPSLPSPPLPAMLAILFVCAAALPTSAAGPDHPIVPAFERFQADAKSDDEVARHGLLLLGELNCTSCHAGADAVKPRLLPKQAPLLTDVGSRARVKWLREFLAAPHAVKPGTTMPDVFAGLSADEKAQRVESLVHFLASTGTTADTATNSAAIARGQELFHTVGCVACHDPQGKDAKPLAGSVPLPNLGDKYTQSSLARFLLDPHAVRPSGRMPALVLTPDEAGNIASYFLRDVPVEANLAYRYFEGSWDKLPDFDKLEAQAGGSATGFDMNILGRRDQAGLVFEGFLQVPAEGPYVFHLGSDDGSRLSIDGKVLIDHDNVHAHSVKSDKLRLAAGPHAIRIDWFEQAGEESLSVEWEGDGLPRQPLAASVTASKDPPQPKDAFTVDPKLAEAGAELFATFGCASCHELKRGGTAIASKLAAPQLDKLRPAAGCLADAPRQGLPNFSLSAQQRTAINSALQGLAALAANPPEPKEQVAQTLAAFNCYACHARDQKGGIEEARDAFFTTTMQEMGFEGRLPPGLDGVGAKLTSAWMNDLFANGSHLRPYMRTRMPRFGAANVGHLVDAFEKLDAVEPLPELAAIELPSHQVKTAGRKMVGMKSLACVKCHDFGQFKGSGIPGINLTSMSHRLKPDWFVRYLFDPIAYRPGTRMPTAWPGGQSLLPDVLDGDARQQVHAVWQYLSDGDKARTPDGLETGLIEIIADKEAVMYRNFIEGAGTRAIGVGYPEHVNLAWDANNLRPALVWHGAFIDASLHWNGRGAGFQRPLGDNVLSLPAEVSLALLENSDAPWPTKTAKELGYKFRGYDRRANRRPAFSYTIGDIAVTDYFEPVESAERDGGFKRTLTLKTSGVAPSGALWFRAATGDKIEAAQDGWYVIDGRARVRLQSAAKQEAKLRASANKMELVIPVPLANGAGEVTQELAW